MVRMRMIPAYDLQATFLRGTVGVADVLGGDGETVSRGIVAAIYAFMERANFAEIFSVNAEESATAFVRIGFRTVGADFGGYVFGYGDGFHFYAGVKTPLLSYTFGTTVVEPCYESFPAQIIES